MIQKVYILWFVLVACLAQAQQVTTFAGSTPGYLDGIGTQAKFNGVTGICADIYGNLYVADKGNNRIRKITPQFEVSTIAGSSLGYQDGIGTVAQFNNPSGICIDVQGNLYVAELNNFKIRKISPSGVVTTVAGTTQGFADGDVSVAQFSYLEGICIDAQGNLFVADGGNNKIRKITPQGMVSTFAGSTGGYLDGQGTAAKFSYPSSLILDNLGNFYITDTFNRRIRKIDNTGYVSTVAGSTWGNEDGQGINAKFDWVMGICIDSLGNLFITDANNHNIRKIDTSGYVSTYAGSTNDVSGYNDGDLLNSLFMSPAGICNFNGNLFITELPGRIRKISPNLTMSSFLMNQVLVYPNPSNGTFRVEMNDLSGIEVFDTNGKIVFSKQGDCEWIETNLSAGMYVVKIVASNGKTTFEKIIIKH